MIAETKTARHQFVVHTLDTQIDPDKPGTIFEISDGDAPPQRVFIRGEIHDGKVLHTRGHVAEVVGTSYNSVSVRFNQAEQNREITFQQFPNFIQSQTKYYPREAVAKVIPKVLTVKTRPREPDPQDLFDSDPSEDKKPLGFFVFSDESKVQRLNQKQVIILELITQKANENKPVVLRDLILRGVIDRGTTPEQVQNILAHLNIKLTTQSSWELTYVPNYLDPETEEEMYAFTLRKNEVTKNNELTKAQRSELKHKVLKLAVRDLLDEVLASKTQITYNVRVLLGDHCPAGHTIPYIFGGVSHQELNDIFMQSLVSAFAKTREPNPKTSKNKDKSQPSLIDLEIQERVKSILQKKIDVGHLIKYMRTMLALTVYQTKEEE